MTIISSRLIPSSGVAPSSPQGGRSAVRSDVALRAADNPFAGAVGGNAAPPAASALRAALLSRVREALRDTDVVDRSPEALREHLLDLWAAAEAGGGEPPDELGNPHAPGTAEWFDYGRQTGMWFRVPTAELADLVEGHALRPDPEAPAIDPTNEDLQAEHARRQTRQQRRQPAPTSDEAHHRGLGAPAPRPPYAPPSYTPPPLDPYVQRLDVREPGVRSHEQEVVLSYLLQLSRASSFLTRAAASGAEPSQLAALAEVALRRDRLDLHVGGDVADRLEESNGFDRDAGRPAVANQAFWLQVRAGQKDFSFGNVHDLLPVAPAEQFARFAQDSRMRLNIDAAGDRMMKELSDVARTMDLDVHDEPQKRRERVAAAISGFQRENAFELVRLARSGGPEALEAVDRELRHLLSLAYEDLSELADYVA